MDTLKQVIDDAVFLGCESVCLSGGEPFQHPDFVQIVSHIVAHRIPCSVYTSGICLVKCLPQSIPLGILNTLRGQVTKYIVNVEAADEATYDKVMGTSFHGFGMMQQFIADAVSLGETVEAHFVPMKLNYRQIPAVVDMCNRLGVSRVSFLRFVVQGRGKNNVDALLLDDNELHESRQMMKACMQRNDVGIRMGIPFSECGTRVNCMTGTAKVLVRYDGNVYPCEAFKHDQFSHRTESLVENVLNMRLLDIYNHSPYLNDIRAQLSLFQNNDTCESCFAQFLSTIPNN